MSGDQSEAGGDRFGGRAPREPMRRSAVGVACAALAALSWGSGAVISKDALDGASATPLLVIQLAGSLVVLWGWQLVRGVRAAAVRDAFRAAPLGLLEPGVAFALGLKGLAATSAGAASLIVASESIMIAALSALILRERLTLRFLMLSMAAFGGLAFASDAWRASSGTLIGDALVALGALAGALYAVLSSRAVAARDPALVVACQQLVGFFAALALLAAEMAGGAPMVVTPSASTLALAIVSGVVQYGLAFSFYLAALRHISSSLAGAFLFLTPVAGVAGAIVFRGEVFSLVQLAGAAVVVGALIGLSRGGERGAEATALVEPAPAP